MSRSFSICTAGVTKSKRTRSTECVGYTRRRQQSLSCGGNIIEMFENVHTKEI
jgi:hypothetical protein